MEKRVICPACGAAMKDPERCGSCGLSPAEIACFADQTALALWKAIYVPPKPTADKLLILSQNKLAVLNPRTHALTLFNQFERMLTMENVRQFSMSAAHWAALMLDGHVEAEGDDTYQQCAVKDLAEVSFVHAADACTLLVQAGRVIVRGYCIFEKALSAWTDIVQVVLGEKHAAGLKKDGSVIIAAADSAPQALRAHPLSAPQGDYIRTYHAPDTWRDVIALEAGDNYILGLTRDGRALALGESSGEPLSLDWKEPIVSIAAAKDHSLGLTAGGTLLIAGKTRTRSRFGGNLAAAVEGWNQLRAIGASGGVAAAVTAQGELRLAGRPAYAALPSSPDWDSRLLDS